MAGWALMQTCGSGSCNHHLTHCKQATPARALCWIEKSILCDFWVCAKICPIGSESCWEWKERSTWKWWAVCIFSQSYPPTVLPHFNSYGSGVDSQKALSHPWPWRPALLSPPPRSFLWFLPTCICVPCGLNGGTQKDINTSNPWDCDLILDKGFCRCN